ncbi:MAG: hypothetical protein F4206_10865, partial [Gammaproteobacteria bacterium]|nr:hypothetical protein [Gammaproteobacteria bacterium]
RPGPAPARPAGAPPPPGPPPGPRGGQGGVKEERLLRLKPAGRIRHGPCREGWAAIFAYNGHTP